MIPKLDAIEKELLFFIGFAHECNMPLLIGDLLAKSEVASQATIHGRLGMLYKKQLIKWQSDSDGRKKYAVPTSKGVAYFSRIGECVYKAAIEK